MRPQNGNSSGDYAQFGISVHNIKGTQLESFSQLNLDPDSANYLPKVVGDMFETVDNDGNKKLEKYTSTAGRFLLANLLPKNKDIKFNLVDRLLPKKVVSEIIDIVFRFCGQKSTVIFCVKLKDLGFKHAFKAVI